MKTIKRGANFTFVSWDEMEAEQHYGAELPGGRLPDQAFDQQWALALLETVLGRLRRRYGNLLRQEVVQTVSTAQQVEEELRHLIEALSGAAM